MLKVNHLCELFYKQLTKITPNNLFLQISELAALFLAFMALSIQ